MCLFQTHKCYSTLFEASVYYASAIHLVYVGQGDLSTPAKLEKSAQEIILKRIPAHMNADLALMSKEGPKGFSVIHPSP